MSDSSGLSASQTGASALSGAIRGENSDPLVDSPTGAFMRVPIGGAEYLDHARRQLFARHPEYLPYLIGRLGITPGMTVVEVGCGGGVYTRLMASQLDGRGVAIGIDSNPTRLAQAQELSAHEGLGELVRLGLGEPTKLPLPDACADRVFCNSLLWRQANPVAALREMRRVLATGGKALAAEPDGGLVHAYLPDRPRLTELERRFQECYARGVRAQEGFDYDIGRRLPSLFLESGYVAVRAYPRLFVAAGCDLGEDPKAGLSSRLAEYQRALELASANSAEARAGREYRAARAKSGGMSDAELRDYEGETTAYLRDRVQNPQRILDDGSIYMYGGIFCEGLRYDEAPAKRAR
jgi:SAM-dependent methyltransferase